MISRGSSDKTPLALTGAHIRHRDISPDSAASNAGFDETPRGIRRDVVCGPADANTVASFGFYKHGTSLMKSRRNARETSLGTPYACPPGLAWIRAGGPQIKYMVQTETKSYSVQESINSTGYREYHLCIHLFVLASAVKWKNAWSRVLPPMRSQYPARAFTSERAT